MVAVSVADCQRYLRPHDGRREEIRLIILGKRGGDDCYLLRHPIVIRSVILGIPDIRTARSRPSRMARHRRLRHYEPTQEEEGTALFYSVGEVSKDHTRQNLRKGNRTSGWWVSSLTRRTQSLDVRPDSSDFPKLRQFEKQSVAKADGLC